MKLKLQRTLSEALESWAEQICFCHKENKKDSIQESIKLEKAMLHISPEFKGFQMLLPKPILKCLVKTLEDKSV